MKKFLVALAVLAGAYASQAAFLYWQIDTTDVKHYSDTGSYYAFIHAGNETIAQSPFAFGKEYSLDVSRFNAETSFYIEIVNYNAFNKNENVAVNQSSISYADLVSKGALYTGTELKPSMAVWHGGASVTPEPTSALMMLMGLAVLGLKRRKV